MFDKLATPPRLLILGASLICVAATLLLIFTLGHSDVSRPQPSEASGAVVSVEPAAAEVMHFWISGSERAALDGIRDAYVAQGGAWIDNPQADHSTLRRALIERISTNTPPVAVLWQSNVELIDLVQLGVFGNLDALAEREGWDTVLSPAVRARVHVDGHYYMAPTNVHGLNWVFYSVPLLQRLGVEEPRTWPELLSIMRRARAAGVRPLAMGPGDWEVQMLFASVLAGSLGRDAFRDLVSNQNGAVLDTPAALEAFRIFGEMRDMAHQDAPYASWADAARAVARGEAAFEFMGDWAKGEMALSGALPGREIGCMLAPGTRDAVILTVDGFAFPTPRTPARAAARDRLASTLLSRDVQLQFATAKGTLAARSDVSPINPDHCEAIMIELLRDPAATLEPPNAGLPAAVAGDFQALVVRFFRHPEIGPEEGRAGLAVVFSGA